jgi:hypothetical protein
MDDTLHPHGHHHDDLGDGYEHVFNLGDDLDDVGPEGHGDHDMHEDPHHGGDVSPGDLVIEADDLDDPHHPGDGGEGHFDDLGNVGEAVDHLDGSLNDGGGMGHADLELDVHMPPGNDIGGDLPVDVEIGGDALGDLAGDDGLFNVLDGHGGHHDDEFNEMSLDGDMDGAAHLDGGGGVPLGHHDDMGDDELGLDLSPHGRHGPHDDDGHGGFGDALDEILHFVGDDEDDDLAMDDEDDDLGVHDDDGLHGHHGLSL